MASILLLASTAACGVAAAPGEPLGKVDFPISCSQAARAEFEHAVALLHHMTYPQAKKGFERVAELDPGCAMAHWGIAMTLFQPLWPTRPGDRDLREGWDAVQRARSLSVPTERERLWVDTAAAFFREPESADYWARIGRWAEAADRLARAVPDDPEAAAFHALALLATASTAADAADRNASAARILLAIHTSNPLHPGAVHYLIHANDTQGRERESTDIVRSYAGIAPRNPHALHMPTHIYVRLGSWDEAIEGNLRAAEAALEQPAGDAGEWVWDEFPHALEYLVYSYLQQGDDEAAAAQMRRLLATSDLQPSFKTAFHLSSIPARVALERQAWQEAASLDPRPTSTGLDWDRFPWPEAVTWFARGLGAAHRDDREATEAARDRLLALEATASAAGEQIFATNIRILRLGVSSWVERLRGDDERAVAAMSEAAALERSTPKHPVTPAPILPADELLGELLLLGDRAAEARAAFSRSLAERPLRFNSLLGAARAARADGDAAAARALYAQLVEVASSRSPRAGLREAREFMSLEGGPETGSALTR